MSKGNPLSEVDPKSLPAEIRPIQQVIGQRNETLFVVAVRRKPLGPHFP
jgi:hypothetical protein